MRRICLVAIALVVASACCGSPIPPHPHQSSDALLWPSITTPRCHSGETRIILRRATARLNRIGLVVRAAGYDPGLASDMAWLAAHYAFAGTVHHTKAELENVQKQLGTNVVFQYFG